MIVSYTNINKGRGDLIIPDKSPFSSPLSSRFQF